MDLKTIRTYNKQAKEYDNDTKDFWDKFPRFFFEVFLNLTKGKILDVGSGPGREAIILREGGLDVVCFDASEKMIELTKKNGFTSILGDFNNMPFKDADFDGVWAYTSLLHVPKTEIEKPMSEIKRVLKPNGIFALGMLEGTEELYRESTGVKMERWFSFYTKKELEDLLEKFDFKILHFNEFKAHTKNSLNFISKKS